MLLNHRLNLNHKFINLYLYWPFLKQTSFQQLLLFLLLDYRHAQLAILFFNQGERLFHCLAQSKRINIWEMQITHHCPLRRSTISTLDPMNLIQHHWLIFLNVQFDISWIHIEDSTSFPSLEKLSMTKIPSQTRTTKGPKMDSLILNTFYK